MSILCLDIETTGLDPRIHEMTVACTFDGEKKHTYHFRKPHTPLIVSSEGDCQACQTPDHCAGAPRDEICSECAAWHGQNADDLLRALDAAEYLGGYNIMLFDLPFVRKCLGVTDARYKHWLAKVLDPFHVAKEGLGQWFSLSKMLQANGLPDKSGSGKNAIELVQQARWHELQEYCMNDTILSHKLLSLPQIHMPRCLDAYMCIQDVRGKKRLIVRFKNTGKGGFMLVSSRSKHQAA